ncbi:DinB family protein [Alicyclobacillus fastidiosus]|uniref:DinB family protein n=1 Tax=Alicyclobacillus fastidiosus TaxID=392011 RepID=A0ABY6ZAL7_9BACL|nr:DinB family protein [Alicyclobacillus fastidiosus]WAH39919.1 DinB family protein [Alicyclobacillus fastidiosus]GMA61195.1 integrase [Alicyclobacillus fastidiosus]
MNPDARNFVGYVPGFGMQLGHLVSMMNCTRGKTVELVCRLSVEQLDYVHDEQSNSIGSLLLHIAAIETAQQIWSFQSRDLTDSEFQQWGAALKLGDQARTEIRGNSSKMYLDCLNEVRSKTIAEFKKRDDTWLNETVPAKRENQYYRWFHVMEDEISHRGQMKWLLNRAMQRVNHPYAHT